MCFDLESNEIRVQWSKLLTIESPEEGRCSSYKTKSGGKLCALHPLENLLVPPHPCSPLIQRCGISLFNLYFSNIYFGGRLDQRNGCMDKWMNGWIDGWMDGWMDEWMDGWMGGWMDGWMDGWMYGWMDG